MKTIIKAIARKIMPAAFILAAAFLLNPVGAQAAKKPGKVTKLEEVKATDTSITVKFKKVKGAKKYQARVYEADRDRELIKSKNSYGDKTLNCKYTWKTKKKLVKKMETKKTTLTVKGLARNNWYAIKIRAYNGKSYGKWATKYVRATINGIRYPGTSMATGSNLKKQYENWKASIIKEGKEMIGHNFDSMQDWIFWQLRQPSEFICTESVPQNLTNYNQYSEDELLSTYKNGYGTNLEIYHVIMDFCKDAGVRCEIKKAKVHLTTKYVYQIIGWSGKYRKNGKPQMEALSIHTNGSASWGDVNLDMYED